MILLKSRMSGMKSTSVSITDSIKTYDPFAGKSWAEIEALLESK